MTSKRKRLFSHLRRIAYAFEELDDDSNLKRDLEIIQDVADSFIRTLSKDNEKLGSTPADVRHPCEGLLKTNCTDPISGAFKSRTVEVLDVHTNFSEQKCTSRGTIAAHARDRGDVVNGLVVSPFAADAEISGDPSGSRPQLPPNLMLQVPECSTTCESSTLENNQCEEGSSPSLSHASKRRCNSFISSSTITDHSSLLDRDQHSVSLCFNKSNSNSVITGLTLRQNLSPNPSKGANHIAPESMTCIHDTRIAKAPPVTEIHSLFESDDEDNLSKLTPNTFVSDSQIKELSLCTQPLVDPTEFSSPSEFLNNVPADNFFNQPSSLSLANLEEKVKMFQSYQKIDFNIDDTKYTEQHLAIAVSNNHFKEMCGSNPKRFLKPLQDFYAIKKIVLIPRSKVGMAYQIDNLGKQYHGTVIRNHSTFHDFLTIFDHVPIQRIHYETEGFADNLSGIRVLSSTNNDTLKYLSQRLCNLFPHIIELMDIPSSKERQIPMYAGGYSNSDAQQYRHNRINQLGNTKPFLIRNRMINMNRKIRREIAMLICDTMKLFDLTDSFRAGKCENGSTREKMRRELWEFMGMTDADEPNFPFFLVEGFSFISESLIKIHMDTGNDVENGYTNTYSLKSKVLITQYILNCSSRMKMFTKALHLKEGDFFPLSLMLYSKKIVGDHCRKMEQVSLYRSLKVPHRSSRLTGAMLESIMDVNGPENYRNLWDRSQSLIKNLCDIRNVPRLEERCGTRKRKGETIATPSKSIPSQFQGSYSTQKPAFDKSCYWSIIIDLLLDININVMPLNARQVMGFIAFCSLEVNGTFLPTGLVSHHLKSKKHITHFKNNVIEHGMYYSLLWSAIEMGDKRYTPVYGSSSIPRHQGHNRAHNADTLNPPAGFSRLSLKNPYKNGFHPATCSESECERLIRHCKLIERNLIELCRDATFCVLGGSKAEHLKKKKPLLGSLEGLLTEVQEIAGKGCSHVFSMNFLQLAGYLGFIPIKILSTSSVKSKSSGGYRFIKSLYPNLSVKEVQEFFEESVKIIQDMFGPCMNYAFAENLLCELYRDRNGSNPKKDVIYFLPHRRNHSNGLQNFFRVIMKSGSQMELEMLGVPSASKVITPGCLKLMSWKNGLTSSCGFMSWEHSCFMRDSGLSQSSTSNQQQQSAIKFDSRLVIDEKIKQFYEHKAST